MFKRFGFLSPFLFLVSTSACDPNAAQTGDPAAAASDTTGTETGTSNASSTTPTSPSSDTSGGSKTGLTHHRCGWVFTSEPAGADFFVKNAASFDAIHPIWYALANDAQSLRVLADADDPVVLEAAKKNHVAVIPLVASVDDVNLTRTMLRDPAKRAANVKAIVDIAVQKGYDGIDIDYEHLWDDGDHDGLVAFYQALSAGLHAAGKQFSMAVPPLYGPSTVWDYKDLATHLDQVHVMTYDFHVIGGAHAGPTSPLGWVDAIGAWSAQTGHPERFILGMPNYGMTTGVGCDLGQCASKCTSTPAPNTSEMPNCGLNTERHFETGRVLSCQSPNGIQFFDDVASIKEKVDVARKYKLGGVAYWKLGNEPAGFLDALKL